VAVWKYVYCFVMPSIYSYSTSCRPVRLTVHVVCQTISTVTYCCQKCHSWPCQSSPYDAIHQTLWLACMHSSAGLAGVQRTTASVQFASASALVAGARRTTSHGYFFLISTICTDFERLYALREARQMHHIGPYRRPQLLIEISGLTTRLDSTR